METNQKKRKIDWVRYLVALIITAAIFGTVMYISNLVNRSKINELQSIQDKMTIDLLSSETQFSLLNQTDCTQDGNSILAPELGEMGDRLSFMEDQLGAGNSDVINLKEYYSLLEIKDYLLVKALGKNCGFHPVVIIYFYSNNNCSDCDNQGDVLTELRAEYPELRVYSFDADLDLSAIDTLETITKVPGTVPALVINNKVYAGFQSIDEIKKVLAPQLKELQAAAKTASSAASTSNTATAAAMMTSPSVTQ